MTEKKKKNTPRSKKKNNKLEELEKEKNEYKILAQRTQADLINSRKRMLKEIEEAKNRNIRKNILDFLPLLDDLELALSSMKEDNGWTEGVRAIQSKFVNTLENLGVSVIDDLKIFDPRLHDALLVSTDENRDSGEISRVLRSGYKWQEEVIRPAQVEIINNDSLNK
ncbi:MAG: nucleotide exchange factor GrpE [Chloroflexi bacterium]|nr:nucleotide exchange factor GrpE [Chloroflexota bacterium]|tara:strand:+ start:3289 stop:3789 length:501 start_codon:yes stop_codon:yes gene_type:complete